MQIKLGKRKDGTDVVYSTTPVTSEAVAMDVVMAAQKNPQRACAAALGLSVPRLAKQVGADYAKCDYDPLRFGGLMIDGIRREAKKHGIAVSVADIITAGSEVINGFSTLLVDQAEVESVEGFSEAAEDGTG